MMQAHLQSYFPLGMADSGHGRAAGDRFAALRRLLYVLMRAAGWRGRVLCHQS